MVLQVGHAHFRAQGQDLVRGADVVLVETLAAGRLLAVEAGAVPGGHALFHEAVGRLERIVRLAAHGIGLGARYAALAPGGVPAAATGQQHGRQQQAGQVHQQTGEGKLSLRHHRPSSCSCSSCRNRVRLSASRRPIRAAHSSMQRASSLRPASSRSQAASMYRRWGRLPYRAESRSSYRSAKTARHGPLP